MSDTNRKIIHIDTCKAITVDQTRAKYQGVQEWQRGKKLRPYIKPSEPYKGRYKRGEHYPVGGDKNFGRRMGNTRKGAKLENANANRSMKKGVRQAGKRQIQNEFELI